MNLNASERELLIFPNRPAWYFEPRRSEYPRRNVSGCQQTSTNSSWIGPNYPKNIAALLDMPVLDPDVQMQHGWNSEDKSDYIILKSSGEMVNCRRVPRYTDGIRGLVGYSSGMHCWQVIWNDPKQCSYAMVGVCTNNAPLTCRGYRPLIGMNKESWGWNLTNDELYHDGMITGNQKAHATHADTNILVILDMDKGTLSFAVNGNYLGIAFRDLKNQILYPAVSCMRNGCEVGIRYINGIYSDLLRSSELRDRRDGLNMDDPRGLSSSPSFSPQPSHKISVLLDMPAVNPNVQMRHGWSSEDKSGSIILKNANLMVNCRRVPRYTDGIHGLVGYSSGVHCWQITRNDRKRRGYAMVGVCTKNAPLTCRGHQPLIGMNEESWGWNLTTNLLYHGWQVNGNEKRYDTHQDANTKYVAPEKILVSLDMDEGTLSFVVNGNYLGIAFRGLKGKTLYPAVSCMRNGCEFEFHYMNSLDAGPLTLSGICRRSVRMSLGKNVSKDVTSLPLPRLLQKYILFK